MKKTICTSCGETSDVVYDLNRGTKREPYLVCEICYKHWKLYKDEFPDEDETEYSVFFTW